MKKKVIVYQFWPIAWSNTAYSSAIALMTEHLLRISYLGVTHVWLSPIYKSPRKDHGYDIVDYCSIDPRLGTMEQFEKFIQVAHSLNLKVVMDLVLNHVSVRNPWFDNWYSGKCQHSEYFCWSDENRPGWKNLFDGGSCWKWSVYDERYYLHLFHEDQADLNWFPNGEINHGLVKEFNGIIDFWEEKGVDGWRLDVPQAINKDLSAEKVDFDSLLVGERDKLVISALFSNRDSFVMMEHFNPTHDPGLISGYVEAGVDFVLDVTLPNERPSDFRSAANRLAESGHFMVASESHDTPRRTSRAGLSGTEAIHELFDNDAQAVCLYQGQELGLRNPDDLTIEDIEFLDAQYAMMLKKEIIAPDKALGESRANARKSIPIEEFAEQFCDSESHYWTTKDLIG